jgi:glycosyltransferase involved in cell wall biosynthesis
VERLDNETEALRSLRAELNRVSELIENQARYTCVLERKLREAMRLAGLASLTVEGFDPILPLKGGVSLTVRPEGAREPAFGPCSRAVAAARIDTNPSWWPRVEKTSRQSLVPNAGWRNYTLNGRVGKVVGISVCGLPRESLEAIVSMIANQQTECRGFVPVFLTDSTDFEVFREYGFVFEYLPSTAKQAAYAGTKDWADYAAERHALLERKWGLACVIRFGPHEFAPKGQARSSADPAAPSSAKSPSRPEIVTPPLDRVTLREKLVPDWAWRGGALLQALLHRWARRDTAPVARLMNDSPTSVADSIPAVVAANRTATKKLLVGITTYNRLAYLEQCVRSWLETRSPKYDWVVIIADDGSTDGTLEYLDQLTLPNELHIIRNERRYACGQTNTIYELSQRIGFDIGFKVDDDLVFKMSGWDDLYVNAIEKSGYQHLCYLNFDHYLRLKKRKDADFKLPKLQRHHSEQCLAAIDVMDCDGSLFTFTPAVLQKVGYNDETNFPIRGQWHIDYSIRCCRVGFNSAKSFYDAAGSNEYLDLQANRQEYRCSISWGPEYKKTKEPAELARRQAVLEDVARLYIPYHQPSLPLVKRINDVFEKVIVLNLDRRTDRWARIAAQAKRHGIRVERFAAVDGQAEAVDGEWRAYAAQPLMRPRQSERVIKSSREFFLDYDSDAARVAYVERRHKKKAIQTPGAWAYLRSMIAILCKCIDDKLETVLVLDDDGAFHHRINDLFARIMVQAPADWKILQLGALQYHWEETWISWYSDNLYCCNGSSVGSHAVGMHCSVFELLREHSRRLDLPYDIGPLHAVKRAFPNQCLTMVPNLVIQGATASDISPYTVLQKEAGKKDNIYRWNLDDFDLPAPAS